MMKKQHVEIVNMSESMDLKEAQKILFDLLTEQEKQNHITAYQLALENLSNGVTKTVVDHVKVAPNAPSALYFPMDESLNSQPNIVGQVLRNPEGKVILVFESADIIELLKSYYGNNILNK